MPTYEYQCEECGSVFDVFQSIKAQPLRKADCETCGEKRKVRRLIGTGGAVIFKGSGFYQTDYRSESYKKAAKAESGDGAKGDTKAAGDGKGVKGSESKTSKSTKKPSAPDTTKS